MADVDKILFAANRACEAAIAAGADFADVTASSGKSLSVVLESCAIKTCDAGIGGGLSVRAIYKGGTGWSSVDSVDPEDAARAGENAGKLARLAEPDPDFKSLPGPAENYPQIDGLFDPRIGEYGIDKLVKVALQNIEAALAVNSSTIVSGEFSTSSALSCLVNSLGIRYAKEGSYIGGHIMAVIKNGEDVGSFYDFDSARSLDDFDPEGIGTSAAKEAEKFLGARKLDTARLPIILGPLAGNSLFGTIAGNLDAESVLRGRSFMAGQVGKKIASDIVSITDDPWIPGGLSSRIVDGEGYPTKPLVLVEDGILKTYLYGSYSAGKAGVENTGHGSRGGSASPSNLVPKLGSKTMAQMIAETSEGLYLNMGRIGPDGTTGDVSSAVDFGFKIENGELAYPVASCMIGGSFLEMLQNIDRISSDYRKEPGMIMPAVRIQDVLVAGAR